MSQIVLPRTLVNTLLHLAQASPEREICGLVGRTGDLTHCYPVANIAEDPTHLFRMDPKGQIDALRTLRMRGETLYAIYHSHPDGPPTPSATDLEQAAYPDALYLIVSLGTKGVLEMRGFYLKGGLVEEVELELYPADPDQGT